jgi:hypothetical protein
MTTRGGISLESEYFRIYSVVVAGCKDSGKEIEYVERWKEQHTPIMQEIKELLEKEIGTVSRALELPLVRYSDELGNSASVSDEEIDVTSAHYFVVRGNGPCAYTMRLENVQGIDVLFIDVCFSQIPDWHVRKSLKERLRYALKGQKTEGVGEKVEGRVLYLHITPAVRALPLLLDKVNLNIDGIKDDFSPWRAMGRNYDLLLLPLEEIRELQSEGWPVRPGDLEENITTEGIPFQHFVLGKCFRVGTAELIISGRRSMDNLIDYEHGAMEHLKALPYVSGKWPQFQQAINERLGFFALTTKLGMVRTGDSVKEL